MTYLSLCAAILLLTTPAFATEATATRGAEATATRGDAPTKAERPTTPDRGAPDRGVVVSEELTEI